MRLVPRELFAHSLERQPVVKSRDYLVRLLGIEKPIGKLEWNDSLEYHFILRILRKEIGVVNYAPSHEL